AGRPDNGLRKGLRGRLRPPRAAGLGSTERRGAHGGLGQSELRSRSAGDGDGGDDFVVERRIALAEVCEQSLECFAPGGRRRFPLLAAAVDLCVDLAPHRALPPFFLGASFGEAPFFGLRSVSFARRASSNM